jgi:hypothetical protein
LSWYKGWLWLLLFPEAGYSCVFSVFSTCCSER